MSNKKSKAENTSSNDNIQNKNHSTDHTPKDGSQYLTLEERFKSFTRSYWDKYKKKYPYLSMEKRDRYFWLTNPIVKGTPDYEIGDVDNTRYFLSQMRLDLERYDKPVAPNSLRVWHYFNSRPTMFYFDVKSVEDALVSMNTQINFDLFLDDFITSNAFGLEIFRDGIRWEEWESENGEAIDEYQDALLEQPDKK